MINLVQHFRQLTDPREVYRITYELIDILVIGLLSTICGGEGWEDMEAFGKAKIVWLKTFLSLEYGIPSPDVFRRVISGLDPDEFSQLFISWVNDLAACLKDDQVGIDGKTLRHSFDRAKGKSPLHLVRAWSAKNRLVLGQVATDAKSNEITAIPELLRVLNLEGALVTIDAMGAQKTIAAQIVDQAADYLLALKGNQETIHEQVKEHFIELDRQEAEIGKQTIDAKVMAAEDRAITEDKGHGRVEVRKVLVETNLDWCSEKGKWKGLKSVVRIESQRTVKGKTSIEMRYYLSSLDGQKATGQGMMEGIRSHWGIENPLHWVLDVQMREDENTIHAGNGPQNLAILRDMAVNLIKREREGKMGKRGAKAKAWIAGLNNDFLMKIVSNGFGFSSLQST